MHELGDIRLKDIARVVVRYRPYILTVLAVLLIAWLLPGRGQDRDAGTAGPAAITQGTQDPAAAQDAQGGFPPIDGVPGGDGPVAAGGQGTGAARAVPGAAAGGQGSTLLPPDVLQQMGPMCDPATGRIKFPSLNAPQCVPAFSGENGGSTSQGVTKDKIKVVAVVAAQNPTTDTILRAAGIYNSPEEIQATTRDYVEMFQAYYETYGRKIDLVFHTPSGDDEAAARADAIKVATEIRAFAALDNVLSQGGAYAVAFAAELAARKVVCMCTVAQRLSYYQKHAPYVYTQFLSSDETYMMLAEYVGKRLAGRPAKWAGDAAYKSLPRKLGITYADTASGAAKPIIDFFESELQKYGAKLASRVAYANAQQDARTVISRLKGDGATTVMLANTPAVTSTLFTQEATRQAYFPEWIVSGGTGRNDTAVFGRANDQAQWRNAFGVSELWVRTRPELHDEYRLHHWHFGRGPTASGLYRGIYDRPWMLLTGIHLAGPKLTPETFRDGLFKFRWRASQGLITVRYSFGKGVKPWDDHVMYDSMVEVWWDPNTSGPDEYGNNAPGIYRFVDGGRRYGHGEWRAEEPAVFDAARAAGVLAGIPDEDKPPTYPAKRS